MDFKDFYKNATKSNDTKRGRVLNYWRSLKIDPIQVAPIPKDHEGSTREEDGIRITGSPAFIASVLARLKDLLAYDNEFSKVDARYEQGQPKSDGSASNRAYINIRQR